MVNESLVDCDDRARAAYLQERTTQATLRELIRRKAQYLRQNVSGAIRGILSDLNIIASDRTIKDLAPHICPLRAQDFEDVGIDLRNVSSKEVVRWWGKYTALSVPCYHGADIVGFYLFTTKRQMYLPLASGPRPSHGFSLVPSFTDDMAVVVDDPAVALRLTVWSAICNGRPTGFIFNYGVRLEPESFGCGETVFWSPEGCLPHYGHALRTTGSRIIDEKALPFDAQSKFPARGNWGEFKHVAMNSLCAHQQTAMKLLDMTAEDVRPLLRRMLLTPNDQAKILAYVSGDDREHLDTLFANTLDQDRSVVWNNYLITDSADGWRVKGKVISAAKLQLDRVQHRENGDFIVNGTISYRAADGTLYSFSFRDRLSEIVKNTGAWLQKRVMAHCGLWPHVERSWTNRLYEVAQQFNTPSTVLADQVYGWNENRLRMPCFSVDKTGVHATRGLLNGPGIQYPAPLSQREWESFRSVGFCRVVLALLGNLVRTSQGRYGVGIMLTNEPHMVSRLAVAFGARTVTNPSGEQMDEAGLAPIPLFTEWSDLRLAEVMQGDGYKNMVLSVDSRTARLSKLRPDWLQLHIGEQLDYSVLRVIFLLLPRLIRCDSLEVDSEMFYRSISDIIAGEVGPHCRGHRINIAALNLDQHNCYKASTAATRITELMFYAIERGELVPEYLDNGVRVAKHQFRAACTNAIIAPPSEAEITQRLSDARFLVDEAEGYWTIALPIWNMNASLAEHS